MITIGKAIGAALMIAALLLPVGAGAEEAPQPRIAVMSAFQPEIDTLLAATTDKAETVINGITFTTGILEGKPVVLMLSGISMVNAAMTTQLLLERFPTSAIVFSGIAGGLNPDLHVGDVVVPARWGQYMESVFARQTGPDSYAPAAWLRPDYPNYGMIHPRGVDVRSSKVPAGEHRFWFEASPDLLAVAERALAGIDLSACLTPSDCLDHRPRVIVGGEGLSGPVFMDNADFRAYAFKAFAAEAIDMETAAVGMVAHANGVPWIAFRSLSDLAGGEEGENSMTTFLGLAAANSAAVVRVFLRALP